MRKLNKSLQIYLPLNKKKMSDVVSRCSSVCVCADDGQNHLSSTSSPSAML